MCCVLVSLHGPYVDGGLCIFLRLLIFSRCEVCLGARRTTKASVGGCRVPLGGVCVSYRSALLSDPSPIVFVSGLWLSGLRSGARAPGPEPKGASVDLVYDASVAGVLVRLCLG